MVCYLFSNKATGVVCWQKWGMELGGLGFFSPISRAKIRSFCFFRWGGGGAKPLLLFLGGCGSTRIP